MVTRAAKFLLTDEFENEPFNHQVFRSEWDVPTAHFETANALMAGYRDQLGEPALSPPTKRYPFEGAPIQAEVNVPRIWCGGQEGLPTFQPVVSTQVAGVEMGSGLARAVTALDSSPGPEGG